MEKKEKALRSDLYNLAWILIMMLAGVLISIKINDYLNLNGTLFLLLTIAIVAILIYIVLIFKKRKKKNKMS